MADAKIKFVAAGIFAFLFWIGGLTGADAVLGQQKPRFIDREECNEDFVFQGEYVGETIDGETVAAQVIALGKGKFEVVGFHGGLPGAGWDGSDKMSFDSQAQRDGDRVTMSTEIGDMVIEKGTLRVINTSSEDEIASLDKVERKSPTLGEKPPEGAVVLFDGTDAQQWQDGTLDENQWLQQGTTSKAKFGSHKLHIEFLLPFMPEDRGQGRGNSGIYIQGRYEVQMLDSFGLEGKQNECGGLYSVKECDVNMCLPPLSWQTYDIEFTAARFENGELVSPPRITVFHNGVKIHDDVELPGDRGTTASPVKPGPDKGPIYLQNHGCPVRYRNIWVVEKE